MQRVSFRVLSAIVGAWLAIVLAEPAALHVCPQHDARPGAGTASVHSHAPVGHEHSAGGHASDASSGRADAPPAHQCACLGHCVGSSVAGSSPIAIVETGSILLTTAGIQRPDSRFSPPAHEFLLPFANGPPLPQPV